jgi:hypothetical protein
MLDHHHRLLAAVLTAAAVTVVGCSSPTERPSTADSSVSDALVGTVSTPGDDGASEPAPPLAAPQGVASDQVQQFLNRSTVPAVLVGTWDGDRADVTVTPSGGFRFSYPNGMVIDGAAVVDGALMTVYFPSQQLTMEWSVEKIDVGYGYTILNLTLDGVSYVRDL